jgi:nitrite reductase/ring-hydroxylating ferredoxin subunit/DMSO/TMAO reductase YedYZ heme-binding membrane subunit
MSDRFRLISWTPYKKRYDLVMVGCIVAYIAAFMLIGSLAWRGRHATSPEILLIRATATAAILLLHITLSIGPLARLDRRFLPLLYNRRHLGVTTFLVALLHATLAVGFYHGFGRINPLVSVLTSNAQYRSVSAFPFEILGGLALVTLFVMAATSHDVWLKRFTPRVWKSIHMTVYVAWLAVVMHVALGALQSERSWLYAGLLIAGIAWLATIHLLAGGREVRRDNSMNDSAEWLNAAAVEEIVEGRGKAVAIPGRERVAIFCHEGKFSAVTNLCAHQGGPLGEGRIIDGCITCPWHGFTYQPGNGCAPPPFTEKIATYQLRVRDGRVWLNINPLPAGTPVDPAIIEKERDARTIER